jgi:anthranilate synthase component 1
MELRQFPDRETYCRFAEKYNVIPVATEILADTETPVSLLRKLHQPQQPLFLLESVEGGERWGRYSFLGLSAHTRIRILPDCVAIQKNGRSREIKHGNRPFKVMGELLKNYHPADMKELPRFWGGLVGYLTYEMVSFFEAIPHKRPPEKPLADFIIPDELVIFDNIRHTLTALIITFPEKDQDHRSLYVQARARLIDLIERIEQPAPLESDSAQNAGYTLQPTTGEAHYHRRVEKTKDYIKKGDIIQAVISQSFKCVPPPDLWMLYRAQRYINPSPYLYFLHMDDLSLVGSSPETMVRLENNMATLRPIAGTRPRGKTEQEDRKLADELLQDEKERAEHLMLVDLARNDLGRVAETGTVQVTDLMVVERYSHVMHLVSNVCCDLKPDLDAWDLLAATFPAGTLSGAPKIRAMEIIAELEENPRGPYGGAVGYVSFNGNMDMAITIRTACVEDGILTVRAGAGIVADSHPENERIETVNKAMALQKALFLIQHYVEKES